jgi:hypothetical protein
MEEDEVTPAVTKTPSTTLDSDKTVTPGPVCPFFVLDSSLLPS